MALCEEVVEEHPQVVVPPDFEDRANNDYHHDLKKVDETMKIPGKTDKCCFCDYKCPTPTEQEEKDREIGFGLLDSLLDHIEELHPLPYEWLSWRSESGSPTDMYLDSRSKWVGEPD